MSDAEHTDTDTTAETDSTAIENTTTTGGVDADEITRGEREPRRVELEMPGDLGAYHHQRHRGGDETIVLISAFGDGFQVFAMDVDVDGQLLAIEEIGDAETEDRAVGTAEFWCQQNPKGILGEPPEDEQGGFFSNLGFGGGGA